MLSTRYAPDLGNASVGIPIRKQNFSWPPMMGRFFFVEFEGFEFEGFG